MTYPIVSASLTREKLAKDSWLELYQMSNVELGKRVLDLQNNKSFQQHSDIPRNQLVKEKTLENSLVLRFRFKWLRSTFPHCSTIFLNPRPNNPAITSLFFSIK